MVAAAAAFAVVGLALLLWSVVESWQDARRPAPRVVEAKICLRCGAIITARTDRETAIDAYASHIRTRHTPAPTGAEPL